ncbi:MAG: hypothetical protein JXA07_07885 [Spirochaetes bacterium]|nr:hypothetical protein [Spirochaetota bacterium]
MYVHATAPYVCSPEVEIDELKAELKNYTDFFFRRVNKFIMLSLLGVHRCVHGKSIDPHTAVFLATENGNLGDTETVLHQLYRENSFPKPFNFINTMSNTASFYVAQSLKTLGRSITVSSKNVSFERALELAMADFELGHIREALVGGVDEAVFSREYFSKKYDASYHDAKLVGGSSWLYLTSERPGSLGEMSGIRTFSAENEAIDWAKRTSSPGTVLAFGILMTPLDKEKWREEFKAAAGMDYIHEFGFYDTAAAFATCKFFESREEKAMIHVSRTVQGHYVLLSCKRQE